MPRVASLNCFPLSVPPARGNGLQLAASANLCLLYFNGQSVTIETSPHVAVKPPEHLTINNAGTAADVARGGLASKPLNQIHLAAVEIFLYHLKKKSQREKCLLLCPEQFQFDESVSLLWLSPFLHLPLRLSEALPPWFAFDISCYLSPLVSMKCVGN